MTRVAFTMRLKAGGEAIYEQRHADLWPEVAALIREQGVRNYTIFRHDLDLIAYFEVDEAAPAMDRVDPVVQRWWRSLEPYMETEPDARPVMVGFDEVWHFA